MEEILKKIRELNLINDFSPSVDAFDLDRLAGRLNSLKESFGESFINNAVAVKANPIRGVLKFAMDRGFGAECASISEAMHSVNIGFEPGKVVFDSPCKTRIDLEVAMSAGIYINLDNEHEIAMVRELLENGAKCKSDFGLRINPIVGGGDIAAMSTATKASKFGVPVDETTIDLVISWYENNPWLNGIHIHVGSQGTPLEKFVRGAEVLMETVEKIESKTGRPLKTIDIGGGLSSSYKNDKDPEEFSFANYRKMLDARVPQLFSGKYNVITEMGRSLFLKCGFTVTRVEHVKNLCKENNPILMCHVGANNFVRSTYNPETWSHRYTAVDAADGKVKTEGETTVYDLSGPMCFQGDFLAKNVELKQMAAGDWLVIHDTGSHTVSMYSRYNSILPSPIYGFERNENGKGFRIQCFKERETMKEAMEMWGTDEPREFFATLS